MSLQVNKAIVTRLFQEVWNQGKVEVLDEIIAPAMICHRNDGSRTVSGPAEQKAVFLERLAGFGEIHVTCGDLIAEGDRVALRWIADAFNPTERLQKVHISIYRIEKGRLVESWTCY
jgi:predicted SnoaL-like aldol condensation-catalyzing enzyme